VGLKLNGTHQLLAYADDVNLLANNLGTIEKNIGTLIDANSEVGLKRNVQETKYTLKTNYKNEGQNREIKVAKKSFENLSQFVIDGSKSKFYLGGN
jgi:putative IMPACT (imprinted ancient) family translation regulator